MDNIALMGIVGSHAYGLNHPRSDVDRLGIFVAPTIDLLGLHPEKVQETQSQTNPDVTIHELRKACTLLIKCNPTVTELLWMDQYEHMSHEGKVLVSLRESFLSAPFVKNAYLGYATQQFQKIIHRKGTFSSDTKERTAKHARHLLRLVEQGKQLWETGTLSLRVSDPDRFMAFGDRVESGDYDEAQKVIQEAEEYFQSTTPILTDHADSDIIEQFLRAVRLRNLEEK